MMIATFAAASLLLAGPKVELSVGVGADSNPFELPSDQQAASADSKPEPGAFTPVEAAAEWKMPRSNVWRIGVDGWFGGRFFGYVAQDPAAPDTTSASDASRWSADVSAPVVFDPMKGKRPWKVEVTAEPFFGMHRETYTSHRDGRPIRLDSTADTPADNGFDPVDAPRRYDTNDFGVKVDGDFAIGRMTDVVVGGRYTAMDYVEDFDQYDGIDSWDYDEVRGDLDLFVRPGDWSFSAGYTLRMRSYDERFPRNADGDQVYPGDAGYEAQEFVFHDVTLRGGLVKDQGRAVVRFQNTRRIDTFEGYQTYTENAVSVDLRLQLWPEAELRFQPGYGTRTYDNLRVNYDPQEPKSNRRRVTIDTSFEWPALSKRTSLFVAAGIVSQSSENPLYSYTAFQGMTGVKARWR